MKPILMFARTTFLGGVVFLMPIVVLAVLLDKAMSLALKIAKPVSQHIPAEFDFGMAKGTLLAIVALALICFLAGLLARTKVAHDAVGALESSVLSKVPAYIYLKQASGNLLGLDELAKHPVVLVQREGGWQIGIQVQAEQSGLVTVFIPNSPNPHTGAVHLVAPERVKRLTAPLPAALKCLKRFGAGSSELILS